MPYVEEIVIAGRVKEVHRYYSARYLKKNIQRSKNNLPTRDAMKLINERRSERSLGWLINTNFAKDDIHLVLTYRKDERPDIKTASKHLKAYLRKMRDAYRKDDKEFKYIVVTEYENKAIHHHLVINYIEWKKVSNLWSYGRPKVTHLDGTGRYNDLAAYLIKETKKTIRKNEGGKSKRRWSSSRNLKKPKIIKRIVKRKTFNKCPKASKGYYMDKDSVKTGVHQVTGKEFVFYRMIRLE